MTAPDKTPARAEKRSEIQALRALAVGSVVGYHFWPAVVPSGFVGVDVFFVISGFLITGLLLREIARTGRMSLGRFYMRRSRRILPAALAVLAATSVVTLVFVPAREARRFLEEIAASALYVENWHWYVDATRPGFAELASSPVQHFWSLSVEEQFYLVWPLVLLLSLWIARRWAAGRRWPFLVVLGGLTVASFVHGVALTAADNNLAYFSTFARAWEFGVGGLLACVPMVAADRLVRLRAAVSWLGLAAIAVSLWTFTDVDLFPGWIALLPVLGTAAVIWGGTPSLWWSPTLAAGLRPVQWLGDVSYSLYLWHWPILLMAPYITGQPSPPWLMAVLLVLSVVVAGLSKRWIEDPFRSAPKPLRATNRIAIAAPGTRRAAKAKQHGRGPAAHAPAQ